VEKVPLNGTAKQEEKEGRKRNLGGIY